MYKATLDWNNIIRTLTLEDCLFILSKLYNNLLFGEEIANGKAGYDAFANYTVWERGSEVWCKASVKDIAGKLNHKSFQMRYDTITHQFICDIGENHIHTDGSCYISIYEYFLNKSNVITISQKEYNGLCEDSLMLTALQGAGVDNWEGYSYAMESYSEMSGE